MDITTANCTNRKEHDILQNSSSGPDPRHDISLDHRESDAARILQRTYRGHRERRQLQGLSLDPSSRWLEAVKEAQYRSLITPQPLFPSTTPGSPSTSHASQSWHRVGRIARRATAEEQSSLSSSSDDGADAKNGSALTPSQKQKIEARRQKKLAEKQDRVKSAKAMDLSYFLEMVDQKHRYGSNLRKYHAEWQKRSTKENFFYWLDQGEGKDVELAKCPRDRLENMQVRYLGKEERRAYEVVVDKQGKLCWRKDGVRVDTSDAWRDSVQGIVPVDDPAPEWAHRPAHQRGSSESSGIDSMDEERSIAPTKNILPDSKMVDTPPMSPVNETPASPSSVFSKARHTSFHDMFRLPTRTDGVGDGGEKKDVKQDAKKKKKTKNNSKFIFVSDTKNNLFIGIKQSGAFQHSSFLHGGRISCAGLIFVKDGQLQLLQPRSGHYRTPSHNLHIFIKSLQSRGVDMSVSAVGGSYAAAVGIEGYMKTKGRWKGFKEGVRSLTLKEEGEGDGEGKGEARKEGFKEEVKG